MAGNSQRRGAMRKDGTKKGASVGSVPASTAKIGMFASLAAVTIDWIAA